MREIKFRGKRVDNANWVYGYFLYGAVLDEHVIWTDHENWIVDPETVGQFIGIYDINGNEIYEGDLLEHDMEVNGIWETYEACEAVYDAENGMYCFDSDDGNPLTTYRDLVVVGNKYEELTA